MKVTQAEMRTRALSILANCKAKVAGDPTLERLADKIHFEISTRMTRAAGKAAPMKGRITLSVPFFADRGNFDSHFENTVTHEIAHVLSPPIVRNGRRSSHGPAWKAMHRRLGGTGERCHDMAVSEGYQARRDNRESFPCGCGCGKPMLLGPTQARRARTGTVYSLKGHRRQRPGHGSIVNIFDL